MPIKSLYYYPVKGLPGIALGEAAVAKGKGFPNDRRYALLRANVPFDPENPVHMSKMLFLAQVKFEWLARLRVQFDDDTLRLFEDGQCVFNGDLREPAARTRLEQQFAVYMKREQVNGRPRLLESARPQAGHMFSDVPERCLSLINLASLRELEEAAGKPLHPLRFRANVYVDGIEAWSELQWGGKEFLLGDVRMRGLKAISRCAATNVNPETAERDSNLPLLLRRTFGHLLLGLYAEVLEEGRITVGDEVVPPAA